MRKRMVSLVPAFERPALPVLPRRSRCLARPNCCSSPRHCECLVSGHMIVWCCSSRRPV